LNAMRTALKTRNQNSFDSTLSFGRPFYSSACLSWLASLRDDLVKLSDKKDRDAGGEHAHRGDSNDHSRQD
jgi:hypothetical protein